MSTASMLPARDLKLDLAALALLALVVFLSCALVTYDPADPAVDLVWPLDRLYQADVLVYPSHDRVTNAGGRWGALAADVLFRGLGLGAYYSVFSLGTVTALLLMRRPVSSPGLRTVGWIGSLVGLATILAMVCPWLTPGPVVGAGGYLGALGHGLLELHFSIVGGFIIALSLVGGGLLLCTDYALIHLASILGGTMLQRLRGQSRQANHRSRRGATSHTDDDDEETVAVRIRGKRIAATELGQDDEDDYEDAQVHDKDVEETGDEEDLDELDNDEDQEEQDDRGEDDAEERSDGSDELDKDDEQSGPSMLRRPGKRRRFLPSLRIRRPPEEGQREEVMQQLDEASIGDDARDYELPSLDLLLKPDEISFDDQAKEVRRKAKILEKTFASFGFQVKVVEIETGPVIAQYEVELEAGLRLAKITGLADDLAIALRVPSVRIVAPLPGKNTVGIEVPNDQRQIVRLREVIEEMNGRVKKMRIPLFLGKDVSGNPLTVDLSTLPHLLIAGRTGTGKSVCLNAIICSMLMTRRPDEVRMLMIDPKMVELSGYKSLPHLMHPVVTDMRKAEAILAWAVEKMEERYELLARVGVRHVSIYNQLGEEELMDRLQPEDDEQRKAIPLHMPYIVIVADEMADLMMMAGKEVEQHIIRLAQKSRAVGIHLILATQKPTVDVITGLIKSNLPARIGFQVASRTDSRVVLDEMGADKLLGSGDLLFLWPGTSTLIRGQGTYLSDEEINAIVDVVSTGEQYFVKELVQLKVEDPNSQGSEKWKQRDELYENAIDVVVREGRGSVSLLQRALGIGYGRAARLIDFMAEDGIVGGYAGSQAREVLVTLEDWHRMQGNASAAELEPTIRRRRNKILPQSDRQEGQWPGYDQDAQDPPDGGAQEGDGLDQSAQTAEEEWDDVDEEEPDMDDTEADELDDANTDDDEEDEQGEAEDEDDDVEESDGEELEEDDGDFDDETYQYEEEEEDEEEDDDDYEEDEVNENSGGPDAFRAERA